MFAKCFLGDTQQPKNFAERLIWHLATEIKNFYSVIQTFSSVLKLYGVLYVKI